MVELIQESLEEKIETGEVGEEFPYESRMSPERMAWGVTLIAFALFCTLTLSSFLGIYFYLFESTVAIDANLRVARGTVGITGIDLIEAVERIEENLTNRVVGISTDSQSQATIQFSKPFPTDEHTLLAAVTLHRNTFMTLSQAVAPRFEWSTRQDYIELHKVSGKLDVLVAGVVDDAFVMRISTEQGVVINLNRNGRYTLTATDNEVILDNITGEAVVYFADDFTNNRLIPAGQEVVVSIANRTISLESKSTDIIKNGLFSLQIPSIDANGNYTLPTNWGCRDTQQELPRGACTYEVLDGRQAVRMKRTDNATSNGETGFVQPFSEQGVEVGQFSSMKIVISFFLNYQSLSRCGIAGSECPIMLLLTYDDDFGITRRWFHGFYYADLPQTDYPSRCSSCIQDHQDISEKVWYTYESENLFALLTDERRPAKIKSIEFYASGHQYDVFVSDVQILVSQSNTEASSSN